MCVQKFSKMEFFGRDLNALFDITQNSIDVREFRDLRKLVNK